MNWFGEPWPSAELRAPVCEDDAERIPTPVDASCIWCGEAIALGDRGEAFPGIVDAGGEWVTEVKYAHAECQLRNVMGCSASALGLPHDHDRPYREDARALWARMVGEC